MIYAHLKQIAEALRASSAVLDHCKTKHARGCHVRIDDFHASPLSSEDAPFLCVQKSAGQELGQVNDEDTVTAEITAGIVSQNGGIAVVSHERTATANGLEHAGDAEAAEQLISIALAVVRGLTFSGGYYLSAVSEDADGWSELPLQMATAQITLSRKRTLGEW